MDLTVMHVFTCRTVFTQAHWIPALTAQKHFWTWQNRRHVFTQCLIFRYSNTNCIFLNHSHLTSFLIMYLIDLYYLLLSQVINLSRPIWEPYTYDRGEPADCNKCSSFASEPNFSSYCLVLFHSSKNDLNSSKAERWKRRSLSTNKIRDEAG